MQENLLLPARAHPKELDPAKERQPLNRAGPSVTNSMGSFRKNMMSLMLQPSIVDYRLLCENFTKAPGALWSTLYSRIRRHEGCPVKRPKVQGVDTGFPWKKMEPKYLGNGRQVIPP